MPPRKNKTGFKPRVGQQQLIDYLSQIKYSEAVVTTQWPTGYGKSIGFALAWSAAQKYRKCNRLLLVVANSAQLNQAVKDFASDCVMVGAESSGCGVHEILGDAKDLKAVEAGRTRVYICTVQRLESSFSGRSSNHLRDLMCCPGTSWMIGFDEFHHYSTAGAWGKAKDESLKMAKCCMAMSATPFRRDGNDAFPSPHEDLIVTHAEAVAEGCLKSTMCASYHYKVAVSRDGEFIGEYTTTELREMSGDAAGLDQWEERKSIRYLPQYIGPILYEPLTRLVKKKSRDMHAQMLVRAPSTAMAECICQQIESLGFGVSVDWIANEGSKYGRQKSENDRVLRRFCPEKTMNGRMPPSLDVLVQVDMASEGVDTIHVCEIIDLCCVSLKDESLRNKDRQFYGRGSRYVKGVITHVNVPSDHYLGDEGGMCLDEWMGGGDPVEPNNKKDGGEGEFDPKFEWPMDRDIEFSHVVTKEEQEHMSVKMREHDPANFSAVPYAQMSDAEQAVIDSCILGFRDKQSRENHEQAMSLQRQKLIDGMVGAWARNKAIESKDVTSSSIGRQKKSINAYLKQRFGPRNEMSTGKQKELYDYLKSQGL
jgi:superfamily II DNA or RNA helicase